MKTRETSQPPACTAQLFVSCWVLIAGVRRSQLCLDIKGAHAFSNSHVRDSEAPCLLQCQEQLIERGPLRQSAFAYQECVKVLFSVWFRLPSSRSIYGKLLDVRMKRKQSRWYVLEPLPLWKRPPLVRHYLDNSGNSWESFLILSMWALWRRKIKGSRQLTHRVYLII